MEVFSLSHPLLVVVDEELNPLAMTHTLLSQFSISHTLLSFPLLPHIHPPHLLLSLTERMVINTLMSARGQNLRRSVRQQGKRSPTAAAAGRKSRACGDVHHGVCCLTEGSRSSQQVSPGQSCRFYQQMALKMTLDQFRASSHVFFKMCVIPLGKIENLYAMLEISVFFPSMVSLFVCLFGYYFKNVI